MSNKRSDDRLSRIPEGGDVFNDEKDRHTARSSSHLFSQPHANPMSQISNSPGLAVMAYCLSSISMTVINKYVVSGSAWNLNFLYLAIQSIVCTGTIFLCKKAGVVKKMSPFDTDKARRWFPISVLLVTQIYTGAKALQFLSVPVFTIFKNLSIIVIAYGEVLWFGGRVTPLILLSFGLMVFSSIIAAWADVQATIRPGNSVETSAAVKTLNAGYAWMGLNVLCSASFVLGMRKSIKSMNFQDWDTMFYNNFLAIPVLMVCTFLVEDWSSDNLARNFPVESRNSLIAGMIYSGLTAIFISYCSAWCIRVTSSTTYSMVGALNKLPIAVSGLVFFDAPITFGSISAIAIGFISGLVYAWGKVRQSAAAKMSLPTVNQPVISASSKSMKDATSA